MNPRVAIVLIVIALGTWLQQSAKQRLPSNATASTPTTRTKLVAVGENPATLQKLKNAEWLLKEMRAGRSVSLGYFQATITPDLIKPLAQYLGRTEKSVAKEIAGLRVQPATQPAEDLNPLK